MDTDIVNSVLDNVVRIDVKVNNDVWGVGSGLLLDDSGNILTCDHVIHPYELKPQAISVVRNSEVKPAQIINFDNHHDLAIINTEDFKIVKSAKHIDRDVHVGEDGFILGFPTGLSNLTLTRATISAKGKGIVTQFPFEIIQVDARVNHGNSGGPLFTEKGEVVGIVTMKYIPFLTAINELHNFVNSLPEAGRHADVRMSGISISGFMNYVNEGVKRMTKALDTVQVGIGWVIPIKFSSSLFN